MRTRRSRFKNLIDLTSYEVIFAGGFLFQKNVVYSYKKRQICNLSEQLSVNSYQFFDVKG
jgi:hypothetical protein